MNVNLLINEVISGLISDPNENVDDRYPQDYTDYILTLSLDLNNQNQITQEKCVFIVDA